MERGKEQEEGRYVCKIKERAEEEVRKVKYR
jgi:hypothetical protein